MSDDFDVRARAASYELEDRENKADQEYWIETHSFIEGAKWARAEMQADHDEPIDVAATVKLFAEATNIPTTNTGWPREKLLHEEIARLRGIEKDHMDDWKRIQDAERECERLNAAIIVRDKAFNESTDRRIETIRLLKGELDVTRLDLTKAIQHGVQFSTEIQSLKDKLAAAKARFNEVYSHDECQMKIEVLQAGLDLAKSENIWLKLKIERSVEEWDKHWTAREELEAKFVRLKGELELLKISEENCKKTIGYWWPILGYKKFNEMVYPALGDPRAEPAPLKLLVESYRVKLLKAIGMFSDKAARRCDGCGLTEMDCDMCAFADEARALLVGGAK